MAEEIESGIEATPPIDMEPTFRRSLADLWSLGLEGEINLEFAIRQIEFITKSGKFKSDSFKIWKTIEFATVPDGKVLGSAIRASKSKMDDVSEEILRQYCVERKFRMNLAKITLGDLGFRELADMNEISEAGSRVGLLNCPQVFGFMVRPVYPEQPRGEFTTIASKPIKGDGGREYLLELGHNENGLVIEGISAKQKFSPENIFIFMKG